MSKGKPKEVKNKNWMSTTSIQKVTNDLHVIS